MPSRRVLPRDHTMHALEPRSDGDRTGSALRMRERGTHDPAALVRPVQDADSAEVAYRQHVPGSSDGSAAEAAIAGKMERHRLCEPHPARGHPGTRGPARRAATGSPCQREWSSPWQVDTNDRFGPECEVRPPETTPLGPDYLRTVDGIILELADSSSSVDGIVGIRTWPSCQTT
jgi:hypothetical protein